MLFTRLQQNKHGRRSSLLRQLMLRGVSLVLTAAVLVGAVWAWYARSVEVEHTVKPITSDTVSISLDDCAVLKYWLDTEARPAVKRFNRVTSQYIEMLPYDTISNQNEKTPVIVVMPVGGDAISGDMDLKVTVSCTGAYHPADDDTFINQYISNILKVRCAAIPMSEFENADTDEKVWQAAVDYFADNLITAHKYITGGTGNRSKPSAGGGQYIVEITIPKEDIAAATYDGLTYLYLELDYDTELVVDMMKQNRVVLRIGSNSSGVLFSDDMAGIAIEAVSE